jgi:hypothetical protein
MHTVHGVGVSEVPCPQLVEMGALFKCCGSGVEVSLPRGLD